MGTADALGIARERFESWAMILNRVAQVGDVQAEAGSEALGTVARNAPVLIADDALSISDGA
jgi:hypothetical protein